MQLNIISPDKNLFEGEIQYIELPGSDGKFGVLENHAPIISSLNSGVVTIKTQDGKEESFDIKGGVVEVQNNKVIVLAE